MRQGRTPQELRPITIQRQFTKYAEGSVLFSSGDTVVLCNATIEERVPRFLQGKNQGWITAEYSMLPRATGQRTKREARSGSQSGRTQEIQRLIGRSLRSVVDLKAMPNITITLDCDVLQADGGTRCAAINGACVALADAIDILLERQKITTSPLCDTVGAISAGIYQDWPILDLDYLEDSTAMVDMNFVMTGRGLLVEVQGTAEEKPFSKDDMDTMYQLGSDGIAQISALQYHHLPQRVQEALRHHA
ncbi:ribonuclease PH [Chrysiogenes arsenatis]|uniref:ribonuclease PH n=1 Tax=Chrysiogenes arsenatis TaxID=309797 RepID=UPI00041EDEE0|nr:ribonuclease PH [Chrysiogenes arsenatis]